MRINNGPSEHAESPSKSLAIYSYGRDRGDIYCVFLFEPGTVPLKGYEYNLNEERITREIEDLQIDRFARFAPKMTQMIAGDVEELGSLAKEAAKMRHNTGRDFEASLKIIRSTNVRDSVENALG